MKGLPKVRFSKKLGIILGSVVMLSGTTGAAAVYIGADTLLGPSYKDLNGLECTEVNSVNIKKKDRFWVRKYITTEPTDGITRVKTALRVAKAVYEAEKPDLVQVVVLDKNGPAGRADMRGRAVGADVVYIPDPSRLPEEAQAYPYSVRYVDKAATANGLFYGDRVALPMEDIGHLVALLDDRTDCLKPVVAEPEGHAAPKGHGAEKGKAADGHGKAAPAGHGEAAAPADGHGAAPTDGHGEDVPVADHETGESKGWMASVMGMVGLGGGDEAPAAEHAAAPADAGHGTASEEAHGAAETAPAADHGPAVEQAKADAPVEDAGWFASVKGLVGLGGSDEPASDEKAAPAATGHGEATASPEDAAQAHGDDNPKASAAEPQHAAATPEHDSAGDHTPPAAEAAAAAEGDNEANAAGAEWLAKLRAKPVQGGTQEASGSHSMDPPAEDSDVLPPRASDKAKAEKAADEHAKASH